METALTFEQGPIRPPSEAGSLLIRATRNCPWNRCAFCSTYRGRKFARRSVDEVKADVDAARAVTDRIVEMSWQAGDGGVLTRRVLSQVFHDATLPDSFRSVALWLANGGDTVFLQDANSLIMSTDWLISLLDHIRSKFPQVERVTSYARAGTLKSKSLEDYKRLKEAGLCRLHVGMESGSDRVLQLIDKGARAEHIIEGGKKVVDAGISLCLYVIPGIGGVELSGDHTTETARVISAVNAAFVRFRSLYVRRGTRLAEMVEQGVFDPPGEDDMVREIRAIITQVAGVSTTIVSDHVLNLLEEVEGKLPEGKQKMLDTIDSYLNMSEEDRLLFQLGRRGGALRTLEDFRAPSVRARLEAARRQIEGETPGGVAEYIQAIKMRYI